MTPDLDVRWLSFEENSERILELRRRVFVEEQGFGVDFITPPQDSGGLHLGAFHRGELISVISAIIYENDPGALAPYRLPPTNGRVVRITKRAALQEHRAGMLNQAIAATIVRASYETLRPEYLFCTLDGPHGILQARYAEVFGFEPYTTITGDSYDQLVLIVADEPKLRECFRKVRRLVDEAAEQIGFKRPSLVQFLDRTGRMDLVALDKLKADDLYEGPLSIKDELPRLSAQTRVLYREQRRRIQAITFPSPPAKLIDIGAGPGVYLSLLSHEEKLRGYDLVGLDISPNMVFFARLNRPDIRWIEGNAYDTGEPSESYDVAHANFVFIHLLNPSLGLREAHRILKPGGIFYIFQVNDTTFSGPPAIEALIRQHCDLYLGDRKLMSHLPHMAGEHGLELCQRFCTTVTNTGTQEEPTIEGDEMRIKRILFWSLFSFLGQREELAAYFEPAQELYFNSTCKISIGIETHVYRKPA